jgi:hypothetical protein
MSHAAMRSRASYDAARTCCRWPFHPNMLDRGAEGLYALFMTRGSLAFGYGAIVVAAVLWGGSIVAQKLALSGFSAVEASVLRDIGGLVILLFIWWSQGGSLA